MTKKKNFISRLFFGVVALTLVSFCFLGSTFARYTSSESGTATVQVAKWDVEFEKGAKLTAGFGKLSPDDADYNYPTETRAHTTAQQTLITITYDIEVDAKLTIKVDSFTINDGTSLTYEDGTVGKEASEANVKSLFTIKLKNGSSDLATVTSAGGTYEINLTAGSGTITISGEVIWTSKDELGESIADHIDTWTGANVTKVAWNLSFTAVQVSEKP